MQRYFAKKIRDNYFELADGDLYHIKTVMRMTNGSKVEIVYENDLYEGGIIYIDDSLKVEVLKKYPMVKRIKPSVNLIIPILKEQKMDYIFQKATELDVDNIYLVPMERCIVKLDIDRLVKRKGRWESICKEASEQSKRLIIPNLYVDYKMEDLSQFDGLKLVCSTKKGIASLKSVLASTNDYRFYFVIGPEGGLAPFEEERLNMMGFKSVSLGENIMRVETVPLYLLSVLNYEYME